MFYFDYIMNQIGYIKDMEFEAKENSEALILRYSKVTRNVHNREKHYICFYADKAFSKYYQIEGENEFIPDVITMDEYKVINSIINEWMWNSEVEIYNDRRTKEKT